MVVSSLEQIGVPRIIQGEPLELWLERELARPREQWVPQRLPDRMRGYPPRLVWTSIWTRR